MARCIPCKLPELSCSEARNDLARRIVKTIGNAAECVTLIPGLTLYRNTAPTAPNPCSYEPCLLIVPQGKKLVELGQKSYVFGQKTFLLTSVELPVVSRVLVASTQTPYLAFFLKLDMGIVRDVLHTVDLRTPPSPPAQEQSFWAM